MADCRLEIEYLMRGRMSSPQAGVLPTAVQKGCNHGSQLPGSKSLHDRQWLQTKLLGLTRAPAACAIIGRLVESWNEDR